MILVDKPGGSGGGRATATVEDQGFLRTDLLSGGPTHDFPIRAGRLPEAFLCCPFQATPILVLFLRS